LDAAQVIDRAAALETKIETNARFMSLSPNFGSLQSTGIFIVPIQKTF
jgi:hypothetical protein